MLHLQFLWLGCLLKLSPSSRCSRSGGGSSRGKFSGKYVENISGRKVRRKARYWNEQITVFNLFMKLGLFKETFVKFLLFTTGDLLKLQNILCTLEVTSSCKPNILSLWKLIRDDSCPATAVRNSKNIFGLMSRFHSIPGCETKWQQICVVYYQGFRNQLKVKNNLCCSTLKRITRYKK